MSKEVHMFCPNCGCIMYADLDDPNCTIYPYIDENDTEFNEANQLLYEQDEDCGRDFIYLEEVTVLEALKIMAKIKRL